jgi:isoleucyl-tRNA synthetase
MIKELPKNYDPNKIEEEVFKLWETNEIYKKIKEKNKGKEKFYFLDGPPYVTNPIHVGTAWNKIIKDSYLRFYRMKGYDVWDIPGYDMHGLPIEVQVEQKLNFKTKKDIENYGIGNFINQCREYALKNLKIQENQFKNLGVLMDWDHPYMTITNEYIEGVWFFIKKAYEKGLLYKGVQVVHWCPRCETVLAGYEVTDVYRIKEDPSLYVKFKLKDEDAYLLVWTTTPWTLPSNVAVSVNPNETYIYALTPNNEKVILAKKRKEEVEKETGIKLTVLKEISGKELAGKIYINPLSEYLKIQREIEHKVILSEEYVSMLEGTGLVHNAPGHGKEDFELGQRYNLPILSPVDNNGRFTEEVERYKGLYIFEANEKIIEDLEKLNAVFYVGKISHRYPHCWRCKTPLILRLSEQWFIDVPKIKEKLIEEALKTEWVPNFALENRFLPWLRGAHEWAISRQRYWGIPLPIWICSHCKNIIVIGSIQELIANSVNLLEPKKIDLHRPWIDNVEIKCNKCGNIAKRIPDVLDVWGDSGAASWASLNYPSKSENFEKLFPADLIIEGLDQTRGWFYTLLVTSVIAFERAPYKRVIMHGWSLDETGRAMHKSLGNVINPEEVIPKYGRDALRVYELMNTTWEDLKFSLRGLQEVFKMLNIIWNTYYFASLYMSLDKFNPLEFKDFNYLELEDLWLLEKLEAVKKNVTESFEKLSDFIGLKILLDFIVNDISRWYIRIIRRRVWIEKEDPSKNAAYYALFKALFESLILLSPYAPFITEYIYQFFAKDLYKAESIHLLSWPSYKEANIKILNEMEIIREIVSSSFALRMKKGIKIRKPIKRIIFATNNKETIDIIQSYSKLLKDQLNVKELEIMSEEKAKDAFMVYNIKLNYAKAGPILKEKIKEVEKAIQSSDPKKILKELKEKGEVEINISSGSVKINSEMLSVAENVREEFYYIETKYGILFTDFTTTVELESESLAREIIRRIQVMRKILDLKITDKISIYINTPSEEEKEMLKLQINYILTETQGLSIEFKAKEEIEGDLIKEWEIDDETYLIGIKKFI